MPRAHLFGLVVIARLGVLAVTGWAAKAVPTTQFTVTGDVSAPATYGLAALESLPPTTETVTL